MMDDNSSSSYLPRHPRAPGASSRAANINYESNGTIMILGVQYMHVHFDGAQRGPCQGEAGRE